MLLESAGRKAIVSSPRRLRNRICHGMALAILLFGLGGVLAARASSVAARRALSARFRLTVALQPKLSEAAVQRAADSLGALPGVASVRLRDPQADQTDLFAEEPWAEEYRQALSTRFLPPILEVALAHPYSSRGLFKQLVERVRAVEGVAMAAYHPAAYERTALALAQTDRLLAALLYAAAILVFLAAVPLEAMREDSEDLAAALIQARREEGRWAVDRLALGLAAGLVAGLGACGLALGLGAWTGAPVKAFTPMDGALLILVGMGAPLAAASLVRAFRRPVRQRALQLASPTPAPKAPLAKESSSAAAPGSAPSISAKARAAYEQWTGENPRTPGGDSQASPGPPKPREP